LATKKNNGKMTIAETREALEKANEKLENGCRCAMCKKIKDMETGFYLDTDPQLGGNTFSRICRSCAKDIACRKDKKGEYHEPTKESVKQALFYLNKPYSDLIWKSSVEEAKNIQQEKSGANIWGCYIKNISMPQYVSWTWENSTFSGTDGEEEINENSRIIKQAKKRFGIDYSPQDLLFLETEYQDWVKRYPCENKAQEVLYKNMCITQLNIENKQKIGKDTKDELKSLQDIMSSLQIKPSQTNSNALTEAKTFGQLIEKWEDEWDGGNPIPEPEPEFADVDKIGTLIDVFFKGHLARMMGLKNGFSHLYEKFIKKYTVNRPQYDEDADSEVIFEQLFGKDEDL